MMINSERYVTTCGFIHSVFVLFLFSCFFFVFTTGTNIVKDCVNSNVVNLLSPPHRHTNHFKQYVQGAFLQTPSRVFSDNLLCPHPRSQTASSNSKYMQNSIFQF